MLLLGHRGCRGFAPENTAAAFDHALAAGCDGFEFDVRLTADGRNVICHDPKLYRLRVADATYDRLCSAVARSAAVPCLEDVLKDYCERAYLYIELKVAGMEPAVLDLVRRYPPRRGFVVASFLPEVVATVHALDTEAPVGLIFDSWLKRNRWRDLRVTHVMPHYTLLTAERMAEYRASGKQVLTWTVNSEKDMRRAAALGVDGVISDDPGLLCRTLA